MRGAPRGPDRTRALSPAASRPGGVESRGEEAARGITPLKGRCNKLLEALWRRDWPRLAAPSGPRERSARRSPRSPARAGAGRWRTDRQPAGSQARLAEASPPARKRGRPTPPPGRRVSGFALLVSTLRGGEKLRRRAWKRQPRPQTARARGRRTAVGAGFYRNSATSRRRVFLEHSTHHYRKHLYCTGAVTSRDVCWESGPDFAHPLAPGWLALAQRGLLGLEFKNKNEAWYTKTFCRLSLSSTVTRKQLRDGAVSVCIPFFLPPSHAVVWLDFFLMHCFCLKNNKYTPATPSGSPPSSQGVPDPMKNRKLGSYLYPPQIKIKVNLTTGLLIAFFFT
ncbi:PREDICTED: uncharacterized protein LOC105982976 [Dipodomys ordii]|uniref:Uncharacterized protein LOC105982976 n=1 Tax=Dipodomys ordii TaxID=10020 RepID=A0A1S3EUQ9_DIPOR|nr:PREDICTED: uncharacterized protein LOC105982976 [Dipodomys ordii]